MDDREREGRRLRRNVEWTLRRAVDRAAVLPMLHRLTRLAPAGGDDAIFAQRLLAELLVDQHPWRAALAARRVLEGRPEDDGAWAILALAYALLGYHRCAVRAYKGAAALAPGNAAYAHNLGHLLDVSLDRPLDALPWLRAAHETSGRSPDVAISLAHALGRAGELAEAKRVTADAFRRSTASTRDEPLALAAWLEAGAPAERQLVPRHPASMAAPPWGVPARSRRRAGSTGSGGRSVGTSDATVRDLEAILNRGLASLPLDAGQRARARDLVRDPGRRRRAGRAPASRSSRGSRRRGGRACNDVAEPRGGDRIRRDRSGRGAAQALGGGSLLSRERPRAPRSIQVAPRVRRRSPPEAGAVRDRAPLTGKGRGASARRAHDPSPSLG